MEAVKETVSADFKSHKTHTQKQTLQEYYIFSLVSITLPDVTVTPVTNTKKQVDI